MITNSLSHNELLHMLSCDPQNQACWKEFMRRFHDFISFVVVRELKHQVGKVKPELMERLLQEVYDRLLVDSAQALKVYRGCEDNSAYRYLEIIAIRIVIKSAGIRR